MKKLKTIYDQVISLGLPQRREFQPSEFNDYIAVGFLIGAHVRILIGRVVQVRLESGVYGSNQVFIRCCDGSLQSHENQWFYKVPEIFTGELNKIFKKIPIDDADRTYSLRGKYKRKGFIIKSPIKPGQTTPMRVVRSQIIERLSKFGKPQGN